MGKCPQQRVGMEKVSPGTSHTTLFVSLTSQGGLMSFTRMFAMVAFFLSLTAAGALRKRRNRAFRSRPV